MISRIGLISLGWIVLFFLGTVEGSPSNHFLIETAEAGKQNPVIPIEKEHIQVQDKVEKGGTDYFYRPYDPYYYDGYYGCCFDCYCG